MRKKQSSKMTTKTKKKGIKSLAEKTEQILLTMPKVIATQINKDLVLLKKQLSKLKVDLRKEQAKKQQLSKQQTVLRAKKTAAAKKQTSKLQQMMKKTVKLITTLEGGIELINKQATELSHRKEKYIALQSQLSQFQKSWAKKAGKKLSSPKKAKIKTKSTTSSRKKTKKQASLAKRMFNMPQTEVIDVIELPLQDGLDQEQKDNII